MTHDPGAWRFSGRWGSAWDSQGNMIAEMVAVAAPIEMGRIDVPLVGSMRAGHKQGPETREGTLRVQKVDTKWELFVYSLLSQSVDARRAARDGRGPALLDPEFTIVLKWDDPEALGVERWQLDGCRIWRLPLGFDINDDLVEREYPLTWELERPLTAFKVANLGSTPASQYVVGSA
jgi:hypothetical protein